MRMKEIHTPIIIPLFTGIRKGEGAEDFCPELPHKRSEQEKGACRDREKCL
jgi:hypothetical protein